MQRAGQRIASSTVAAGDLKSKNDAAEPKPAATPRVRFAGTPAGSLSYGWPK